MQQKVEQCTAQVAALQQQQLDAPDETQPPAEANLLLTQICVTAGVPTD